MKKILALIMIIFYTTASSGMVLNMHYCMGKLSSVKLDDISLKKCMCGEDEPAGGCCTDIIKVVKVDNLHKAAVAGFNIEQPDVLLPMQVSFIDLSKLPSQKVDFTLAHSPPGFAKPPLNLLNCVFRV